MGRGNRLFAGGGDWSSMKVPSVKYYKTLMKEQRAGRVKDIIKKYNIRLVKGICSKVSFCISVGNSLLSANIIPERMYHEIARSANKTDPELDMIFASRIMSTVRKVLYKDPDCFPVIMNVFRKHPPLDSLVAKMEREYCEFNIWNCLYGPARSHTLLYS